MATTVFLPLCIAVTLLTIVSASPALQRDDTEPYTVSDSSSLSPVDRFFFSKQCETVTNSDTGAEEECCSGNFSCSAEVCKGKGVCGGFLGGFFWCSARECKPKGNGSKSSPSPKPTNTIDDLIGESGEPVEGDEGTSGDNDTGGDPLDDGQSPTPSVTPSATPSTKPSASPSSTPSSTPSTTPTPSSIAPSPVPTDASPPWMNNIPDLNCDGNRRQRREIRDLEPWERRRWENAILQLRKTPAPPQNGEARQLSQWDMLVKTHQMHGDEAHGGCYFLLWHRLFLLKLENMLRRIEPDLALPYWDWTRDSEDASLSEIWGPEYVGGARKPSRPIQNGAFAWMDAIIPEWHHVARDFDSGVSGSMPALWSWSALNGLLGRPQWEDFADGLESAHILPHVAVGGDMVSTHHAPNDPVFYLHHAYIDFVYAIRQGRHWRYQFGGTHDFAWGTQQCSADHVFGAFGVPARNGFDIWCVDYIAPVTRGINSGVAGRTQNVVKLRCSDQEFLDNTGMTEERCRRGASFVE